MGPRPWRGAVKGNGRGCHPEGGVVPTEGPALLDGTTLRQTRGAIPMGRSFASFGFASLRSG
jgi:hypothetical protein